MIPYDLRRTAVWNFERTGVSRSVAMQLTERVIEPVYRRFAIVSEGDLSAARKSSANSRRGQFRGQKREGAELRESVKH
jgi:hypothetical protein